MQLANAYLARIGKLNPELNAYVTITRDLALREARDAKPGAPLYGIPIAHKDLIETKGVAPRPARCCSKRTSRTTTPPSCSSSKTPAQCCSARPTRTSSAAASRQSIRSPAPRAIRSTPRASPADRAAAPRPQWPRACASPQPAATPAAACAFLRRSAAASASSHVRPHHHARPARLVARRSITSAS